MMKKDWTIKKLGELCRIRTGKLDANAASPNGKYPFFTCSITPLKIDSFSFDCECVLVAGNGDLNVKYYEGKFDAYQRTYIIESLDKSLLDVKYLYLFLSSYIDTLRKQAIGAIIKYIKLGNLTDANLPLPSLEEQKRIVAVLDKKFAQIETLKTAAEKNLQNTKQLFQAELEKAFSNTSWEKKQLGDYCEVTDGDHMPPPKSKTGYPFITISNIDKDLYKINFEDTFFVPEDYFKNLKDNRKPKKGDVLYTVTGSYGIPVLINGEKEFCFQRHIGLLRPNSSLSSEYLFYWILTPKAKSLADEVATGTAQRTVSLGSLRTFEIPLPPLEEQKNIVAHLDSLSEKVHQLEDIYTKQLANCDELKQSLLQKAFEGEL